MRTYKFLAAGLALASLLTASVASAQTASSTAVLPTDTPDLGIFIGGNGISLDATQSSASIQVLGLPVSFSGAVGGTCTITNAGTTVGTTGTDRLTNPITVPAGSVVTLPVSCTGSTPGTYNVSMVTSVIPAIVANTSRSITPHGTNHTTLAQGTITIGSGGTGNVTGTGTSGGSTSGNGQVQGTSTGANLPSGNTSGAGSVLGASTGTPSIPNTGMGGAMATNLAVLALAGLMALGGFYALRRYSR